jgi:hypothetical protein
MRDERLGARFALGVLATWRVTHLLAEEDGPGDLVVLLRARAGDGWRGRLMDCFYCLSVWTALPFALVVARRRRDAPVAVLALSGAACLLERATAGGARELEHTQLEGGSRDVLWRQAQCDEGRDEGSGDPAGRLRAAAAAAPPDGSDPAADAAVGARGPGGHLRALDDD